MNFIVGGILPNIHNDVCRDIIRFLYKLGVILEIFPFRYMRKLYHLKLNSFVSRNIS